MFKTTDKKCSWSAYWYNWRFNIRRYGKSPVTSIFNWMVYHLQRRHEEQ